MLAAERGAAANTLAAYTRDLAATEALIGPLAGADRAGVERLAQHWATLAPSSLARRCSALRQCFGFLVDEHWRADDPSPALPRPRSRRPLPRILSHAEVEALFATAEAEAAADGPERWHLRRRRFRTNGRSLRSPPSPMRPKEGRVRPNGPGARPLPSRPASRAPPAPQG